MKSALFAEKCHFGPFGLPGRPKNDSQLKGFGARAPVGPILAKSALFRTFGPGASTGGSGPGSYVFNKKLVCWGRGRGGRGGYYPYLLSSDSSLLINQKEHSSKTSSRMVLINYYTRTSHLLHSKCEVNLKDVEERGNGSSSNRLSQILQLFGLLLSPLLVFCI